MKGIERKDKMYIFSVLMRDRGLGWTDESIKVLNLIDIVFVDDLSVRNQWKEYFNSLALDVSIDINFKKMETEKFKLLEIMSNSLGYKEKITWEHIQNPYVPKWKVDYIKGENEYRENQSKIMQNAVESIRRGEPNGKNENGVD